MRNFFDLRREANRFLLLLWKYPFSISSSNAKTELNEIGARLVAFDQSEPFAAPFIRWLGYQPRKAGAALMIISDRSDSALGKRPDDEYRIVKAALKFPN
jgi:hypothetical protein